MCQDDTTNCVDETRKGQSGAQSGNLGDNLNRTSTIASCQFKSSLVGHKPSTRPARKRAKRSHLRDHSHPSMWGFANASRHTHIQSIHIFVCIARTCVSAALCESSAKYTHKKEINYFKWFWIANCSLPFGKICPATHINGRITTNYIQAYICMYMYVCMYVQNYILAKAADRRGSYTRTH